MASGQMVGPLEGDPGLADVRGIDCRRYDKKLHTLTLAEKPHEALRYRGGACSLGLVVRCTVPRGHSWRIWR